MREVLGVKITRLESAELPMINKILSLLLVCALLVSCGGSGNSSSGASQTAYSGVYKGDFRGTDCSGSGCTVIYSSPERFSVATSGTLDWLAGAGSLNDGCTDRATQVSLAGDQVSQSVSGACSNSSGESCTISGVTDGFIYGQNLILKLNYELSCGSGTSTVRLNYNGARALDDCPSGYSYCPMVDWLTAAIGPDGSALWLSGAHTGKWPVPLKVQIDSELIICRLQGRGEAWDMGTDDDNAARDKLKACERGVDGTTKVAHAAGAKVILVSLIR